jgi:hypothetical protein
VSGSSCFERRLREVARMIEELRGEGCGWEELHPLELERRALEWLVGVRLALKSGARAGDRM